MPDQSDATGLGPQREAGDWIARQFFTPDDLKLSPEEYAARHGHLWDCFSLDRHRYNDPQLGAWVKRLGEILASPEEVERCRCRFLSPDELVQVRREQAGNP